MSYRRLIIALRHLSWAIVSCIVLTGFSIAADFDHSHKQWSQLLNDVVVLSKDKETKVAAIENGKCTIRFKDYNWKLNDVSTF